MSQKCLGGANLDGVVGVSVSGQVAVIIITAHRFHRKDAGQAGGV